ncbi:MAG: aminoglycoside phosphotransferase family protein [Paenisporosarcina sp.]
MEKLKQVIKKFGLNVLSIEDVPESFSSSVYKIKLMDNRTVFIKIPYTKVKLEREYAVLERLQHELPVPQVLNYWEGNEDVTGAFMLSAINGLPIAGKVDVDLAYDIGIHHANFHSIQPSEQDFNSPISNEFEQWTKFIKKQFYSFAEDVKEVIDSRLYEQSLQYFVQNQKFLPAPDGPRFIHMDFRPGNILVNENKVVGIIDFESVRIGSTEIDFTKINRDIFVKYPGTMEAFQRGYESIRPLIDLQTVLPFYRFIDAFNSIGWCKRRGSEKNESFLQENKAYLIDFLRG